VPIPRSFVQQHHPAHHPDGVIHAIRVMFEALPGDSMDCGRKGGSLMDATTEFFNELGTRGHEPLLENATGALRFDLANGKRKTRWLVTISKGDVTVSHANGKADCVTRVKQALFDQIVTGEENAMAAVLRGEIAIEGKPQLLVLFQRLFPGPQDSKKQS
jgi:putative sterol carrier protein